MTYRIPGAVWRARPSKTGRNEGLAPGAISLGVGRVRASDDEALFSLFLALGTFRATGKRLELGDAWAVCFGKGGKQSNTLLRAARQFTRRAHCAGGVVATWTAWTKPAAPREWRARAALVRACVEEFDIDLAALAPLLAARLAPRLLLAAKKPAKKPAAKTTKGKKASKKASKAEAEAAPPAPARASKRERAPPARLADAEGLRLPKPAAKRAAAAPRAPRRPRRRPSWWPRRRPSSRRALVAAATSSTRSRRSASRPPAPSARTPTTRTRSTRPPLARAASSPLSFFALAGAGADALPAPPSPLRGWAAADFPAADPLALGLDRTDLVFKALAFPLPIPEALGA